MYVPKHFEIQEESELFSYIRINGFGQLISSVEGRLFSTPLPFVLSDDNQTLITHVARQNPQADDLDGQEVLISLMGPHAYISPTWYEISGGVPTWNYQSVQVYGTATVVNDRDRNKDIVELMSTQFEGDLSEPWDMQYPTQMLDAILGIEISISEIQGKYKLSQNRPAKDQQNVIRRLSKQGNKRLANEMSRFKKG
ncbi:MAG: FMN-binding negative transcriptional regulator [Neptuniibacter sp.]